MVGTITVIRDGYCHSCFEQKICVSIGAWNNAVCQKCTEDALNRLKEENNKPRTIAVV